MKTISLPETYDYLAPDGAQIRLLLENHQGGVAHCVLEAGAVSKAVKHKTVSEFWYVLSGEGELWRKKDQEAVVVKLAAGVCIDIPQGAAFQYRAAAEQDLAFLCVTMPPWPGAEESVDVAEAPWG